MKTKKWIITSALLSLSLFLSPHQTVYASEKIKAVSIKMETESDDDSDGTPALEIKVKGSKYYVDSYEVINSLEDEEDSTNGPGASSITKPLSSSAPSEPFTCEIILCAYDDYTFDTLSKSDIKITGLGANCTKASRKDSAKTLVLTVEFHGIQLAVGSVDTAAWENTNTAKWSSAKNAVTYTLKLYKEGKLKGTYETGGTQYNFAPAMLREGTYHYTIKAMNEEMGSKERAESETVYIDASKALEFQEKYALVYDNSGAATGPDEERNAINSGWKQDGGNYWYQLDNGMFPQMNWLLLGDSWYFFDEYGYLVTDSSIVWKGTEYQFDQQGEMIIQAK